MLGVQSHPRHLRHRTEVDEEGSGTNNAQYIMTHACLGTSSTFSTQPTTEAGCEASKTTLRRLNDSVCEPFYAPADAATAFHQRATFPLQVSPSATAVLSFRGQRTSREKPKGGEIESSGKATIRGPNPAIHPIPSFSADTIGHRDGLPEPLGKHQSHAEKREEVEVLRLGNPSRRTIILILTQSDTTTSLNIEPAASCHD